MERRGREGGGEEGGGKEGGRGRGGRVGWSVCERETRKDGKRWKEGGSSGEEDGPLTMLTLACRSLRFSS